MVLVDKKIRLSQNFFLHSPANGLSASGYPSRWPYSDTEKDNQVPRCVTQFDVDVLSQLVSDTNKGGFFFKGDKPANTQYRWSITSK